MGSYQLPSICVGESAWVLIVSIGIVGGIGSAFFNILPLNLVSRAFKRFRPVALTISALGSPIGSFVMPYVASGLYDK